MAWRRSRVRGVTAIRAMLRRLPDGITEGLVTELHRGGREMAARMQGRAPSRTGATRRGISYKVFPKTLRMQVGLLGTKRGRSKIFYARIQDLGRRAQVATARRFRAGGQRLYFRGKKFGPDVQTYQIRVPAMKGKHFITGRMPDLRRLLQANLKSLWSRALGRVRTSGGD
jgi:hypothetical protein